jgi:hypothetical protein
MMQRAIELSFSMDSRASDILKELDPLQYDASVIRLFSVRITSMAQIRTDGFRNDKSDIFRKRFFELKLVPLSS